jgi:hypothetical protein
MPAFVLLEDRYYLSESIQLDLFQTENIKLETPKRTNQKDDKPQLTSLENQGKESYICSLNYVTNL